MFSKRESCWWFWVMIVKKHFDFLESDLSEICRSNAKEILPFAIVAMMRDYTMMKITKLLMLLMTSVANGTNHDNVKHYKKCYAAEDERALIFQLYQISIYAAIKLLLKMLEAFMKWNHSGFYSKAFPLFFHALFFALISHDHSWGLEEIIWDVAYNFAHEINLWACFLIKGK